MSDVIPLKDEKEETIDSSTNVDDPVDYFRRPLREAVDAIPENILEMTEGELQNRIRPTEKDWAIRNRYWDLVKLAKDEARVGGRYYMNEIYSGICSAPHFSAKWLTDPYRVAWLLLPIENEKAQATQTYHFLVQKLKQYVLNVRITEDNLGDLVKLAQFLSVRAHGIPTQKHQHAVATLDLNKYTGDPAISGLSREEIDKKIKEIESKQSTSAQVIDVDPG